MIQSLLRASAVLLLCVSSAQAEKPNVLFIPIDDMNDWVTHLGGHPQAITPNLDRLAQRSLARAQYDQLSPAEIDSGDFEALLCQPDRIGPGAAPELEQFQASQ